MTACAGHVRAYVDAVLRRYADLPGTPSRSSRQDRRLAAELHRRGIPLPAITTALLLGAARRALRPQHAPALAPIRTLHYFLPLLDEILELPPEPGFLSYLEHKLQPLLKSVAHLASTSGLKPALPGGR